MLKTFLIPLGCFGVPLTAGFAVLAASGVVNVQIFSSEESHTSTSKYRLVDKNYSHTQTQTRHDDNEEADDTFMQQLQSRHRNVITPQPRNALGNPQQSKPISHPIIEEETKSDGSKTIKKIQGNKITLNPTRKPTRGEMRKISDKIQSQWNQYTFQKIVRMFAQFNSNTYRNFANDVVLLVNDYWSTTEQKRQKISELIAAYNSEISEFSESEKRIFKNNLESLIL